MLQPKLRFQEFINEWKNQKLSAISELTSSKRIFLSEYVSKGIPFYRGKEISELKKGKKIIDVLYISEKKYEEIRKKYGVPQKNDILITAVGTLGNIYLISNENKFYFKDGNLIWLRNIKISSEYLVYNLEYNKKQILDSSIGSTQKALTIVNLNKLSLNIPNLEEQEKIADFLSSVDVKINLTENKLELLKEYKKGIMQKIFNQELRFKDSNGNDYPEWEEKKLGDITKFSKGKLISKEDITDTGVECIRYGELYTTYNEVINKVVSKTNLDISTLVLSEKNDIIIPCSGETAIDIAKASCLTKSGVALGGDLNILKLNENGIFLSYYLNNKAKYQIVSLAQGASVVHLYEDHLKKLKIKVPILQEQQKIADFLSAIDSKIEKIYDELENLKEFKKGLFQQMFV
ncbi:restriction endonuclease subunit S [Fusobacterium perfoetens]|uniref:restriction endonuclease subunit S n=1 Tax=Fusobacterium perfoetens TaxID=852 RepID=UPI001F27D490|nr:restriction endonuclease subunit S [Fusobacterium perfoetens]MCF2612820.1 restriction endonuclease subunit S [Fusobacterium perfoetens]